MSDRGSSAAGFASRVHEDAWKLAWSAAAADDGALITAGAERRTVSRAMTSFRERTSGFTTAVLAATGAYLVVLFSGVAGSRAIGL